MFELSRESDVPLVEQICERLTQLVRHGQLGAGTRLPSIRRLARQIGASPFPGSVPSPTAPAFLTARP